MTHLLNKFVKFYHVGRRRKTEMYSILIAKCLHNLCFMFYYNLLYAKTYLADSVVFFPSVEIHIFGYYFLYL